MHALDNWKAEPKEEPIRLSTGRLIVHTRTGPDTLQADCADGGQMSDDEWNEYARLMIQRRANYLKEHG